METSDESILNNQHVASPTLELIDLDGSSSNTSDFYSKSNAQKDPSSDTEMNPLVRFDEETMIDNIK